MIGNYYCEYEDRDRESEDSFYSDKIDSDLEAELYGLIHHEQKSENDVCDDFNITDNKLYSDNEMYLANRAINKHLIGNERNVFECNDESLFISKCGNSVRNAKSIPGICFKDHHRIIPNSLNVAPIQPKDFNRSQKRKSDSNNDVENITNKKLKKESEKRKNETVNLESSDSDSSVIYCEPSTSSDQQTNLSNLQTTIILSSEDSDSDSSIFKKSGFSFKKNASVPNIKFGEFLSDPWQVNSEDLYRSKKFSNRYHSRLPVKCNNCKESGHIARFCRNPCKRKCYMCGGDHFSFKCERLFCYKCRMKGHTAKQCWRAVGNFCSHCNINGHLKSHCPDIWRRYHLTTTNSKLVEAKDEFQDKPIYCYNCGLKGHFGGKCTATRMHSNSILTWPLVISYNNPSEMRSQIQEQEHQLSFHSRGESGHCSSFHRNGTPSYSRESQFDAAYPIFHEQKKERNYRENMNESNKTPKELRNNYFTSRRKPFDEKKKKRRILMKERKKSYNGNSSLVRECYFPRSPRTVNKVPDSEYNNRTPKTQRNCTQMLQTSVVIEDEDPKIVKAAINKRNRMLKKLRKKAAILRDIGRKNINS